MVPPKQPLILVLGSGVAGVAIAYELTLRGRQVALLFRDSAEGSSFTNQKWKHSGLLYPNESLARRAWQEYQSSHALLKEFVVVETIGARFLALEKSTLEERSTWWRAWDVASWGLTWRPLKEYEYGDTAAVGGFHAPDCVIDFPALIGFLRTKIEEKGGTVLNGAAVKRVVVDRDRVVGVQYQLDNIDCELGCDHCIVSMGAWSLELLMQSQIATPPIIRKKCVVLTYDRELVPCISVCLDACKKHEGVADATLVPFSGSTLAAGTSWSRVVGLIDMMPSSAEVEDLVYELAQCFPSIRDLEPRAHVCIKTERDTGGRAPDVEPKVYRRDMLGVSGLTVALPGKASFMFRLAQEVASAL